MKFVQLLSSVEHDWPLFESVDADGISSSLNNEKSALISLLDDCDCDEWLMLLLLLALAVLAGFDDIEGSLLFSTTVDRQISSSLAAFAALFVAGSSRFFNPCATGFNTLPLRIESSNCSRGDGLRFNGASFLSVALRSGGRDLINSRITACASFFTRGGISPFTITLRRLYFLDLMSSIKISYGVISYSVGI